MGRLRGLSVERFIDHYMTAHFYDRTREELAYDLSISPKTILRRVAQLRHMGIAMPPMPLRRKKSLVERAKAKFAEMEKQLAHSRAMAAERAKRPPIDPKIYELDMERVKELRRQRLKRERAERQKPTTPK